MGLCKTCFLGIIILFFITGDSFSKESQTGRSADFSSYNHIVEGKLNLEDFQILEVELLRSTLEEIRIKMKLESIEKAGEFSYLCIGDSRKFSISFESKAMLNALNYEVTRIVLSESGQNTKVKCRNEKIVPADSKFKNGLRLGLKKSEIQAIMGKPQFQDKTKMIYNFTTNTIPQLDRRFERSLWSGVEIVMKGDRSIKIIVNANYHFETL